MENSRASLTESQLDWARRLQAIAQNGRHFSKDPHDLARFGEVLRIAAEMLAPAEGVPALVEALAVETGYATPKVDTRAVVVRDEKILLVREAADGLWTLPGGWADPGERPSENCVREVREEAGLDVRVARLLAVYDREIRGTEPRHFFHAYKLFVHCEIVGGELRPSDETPEVAFFEPAKLPPLSLGRVTAAEIHRCLELIRNPTLPADFD